MTRWITLSSLIAVCFALAAPQARAASYVTVEEGENGQYIVEFGGRHFTTVHTKEFSKPILYPIIGPHGVRMTRDFPMKKDTPGERADHPHHQSLWYTHGAVNGADFWALGKGRIVTTKVEKVDSGSSAWIVLHNKWVGPDEKAACTDTQKIVFHKPVMVGKEEVTALDYIVTIHASEGDVTFGDTKEGTMGIRTHPGLRINNGAAAVNSEGVEGKAVWGKRAKWVSYAADIDGKTVGMAIFDHPSNPRYPTWWHARDYGLVAANPFGVRDFERKGSGDFKIEKGKSVTFKYRFLFHTGDTKAVKVSDRFEEWTK